MKTEEIITYLNSQGMSKDQAGELANKIEGTNPKIYQALIDYIRKGIVPDLSVEGFTCKGLMDEYRLSITGALLTLDWLIREPEEAARAIKEGIK